METAGIRRGQLDAYGKRAAPGWAVLAWRRPAPLQGFGLAARSDPTPPTGPHRLRAAAHRYAAARWLIDHPVSVIRG
jgi:hypothetical protein